MSPKLASDQTDFAAAKHREHVEACRLLLDPAIPLGMISFSASECAAIERYYRRKHARGQCGAYFLHQVRTFNGPTSAIRRGK